MLAGSAAATIASPPGGGPSSADGLIHAVRSDGTVDAAFRSALEVGVSMYQHMVMLRLLSARMVELQRTEKIAFHSSSIGEEAAIVGAALAGRPNDWLFPSVREWGVAIVRGLPLATYLHHAFGSGADPAKGHSPPDHPPGRAVRVVPASGLPGAHVPQAVGGAWAAKIQKHDVATIALFGDSASAGGDLHNALNFAGVFKVPCVFVCREDGRVPASGRSRETAYGLASARVDGSDPLAVLSVVRAALARAARGEGATLIDAVTTPSSVAGAEVLSLGDSDPLVRFRRTLEREGLLDAAADEAIAKDVRARIDAAVSEAESAGPPARSTIFDDVYAQVPAHLAAQRAQKEFRS